MRQFQSITWVRIILLVALKNDPDPFFYLFQSCKCTAESRLLAPKYLLLGNKKNSHDVFLIHSVAFQGCGGQRMFMFEPHIEEKELSLNINKVEKVYPTLKRLLLTSEM